MQLGNLKVPLSERLESMRNEIISLIKTYDLLLFLWSLRSSPQITLVQLLSEH